MADQRLTHIKRLLSQFESAACSRATKGAQPPSEHAAIEQEYQLRRNKLLGAVRGVMEPRKVTQ